MREIQPQNLTHRGTVLAEAFLLSAKILSEKEMRKRALEFWQAEVQIFRFGEDLIVRLPEPVRVDTGRVRGLPFVRYGNVFSAFPLSRKDLETFRDLGEILIFLQQGAFETIRWQELKTEKIENWFNFRAFHLIETESLGETVTPPAVMKSISEEDLNLRNDLMDVPPADPELSQILGQIKEIRDQKQADSTFKGVAGTAATGAALAGGFFLSLLGGVMSLFSSKSSGDNPPGNSNNSTGTAPSGSSRAGFFSSLFGSLMSFFSSGSGGSYSEGNSGYTQSGGISSYESAQNEPGLFEKIYNRLRHLAVKAVIEMRMAKFFGRRQAKYLAEMMEKFERGDLSEALKYAIPLEDMEALRDFMQKPMALFVPRPRSDLQISFGQSTTGSSINLETEWFERLRQLYRQSFEQLEAQGRIEEAAFVLAELLKSNQEAVEFLAKHGRFRLAAELAEARNLPKEIIVRQWFLAGEKMRAVRLAIIYNCFEYAVTKLEQENSETGAELREVWAESLAQSGNFSAAVDIIWKLEDKRPKAKDWIEKTIEFGGIAAARMLARKAMLFPDSFPEIRDKFQEILREDEPEGVEKRNAFARAIFKQNINDELRILLRPLVRKILNDAAKTPQTLAIREFRELVVMAKDTVLRTDLPAFPQISAPTAASECFEITIDKHDKGANHLYDACILPDGKIAVALGETGVKILSRYGKTIAYFDQPAQKFVISDFATKAIILAKRGETVRLARIDFIDRKAGFWADARLDSFAPNFDGYLWFVGSKDEFYAIDTTAKNFEAVWNVPETGGQIHSIVRSKNQAKFLTLNAKGFESWWYELPSLTLRSRNQRTWLESSGESFLYKAGISEGGFSVVIMLENVNESEETRFFANIFDHEHLTRKFELPAETNRVNQPEIFGQYSALTSFTENQAVVFVLFAGNLTAQIILSGAQNVSTRFDENYLTFTDDCGRLLVYDYKNRTLRQNIRF